MATATESTITIVVPIPPDLCDPNKRTRNHRYRASHISKARAEARLCAMAAIRESGRTDFPWNSASVEIKWYHKTARFRDRQNIIATLKATIDGFEDAQVFRNDRDLGAPEVERLKDAKYQRVEITLTKCR